MLTFVIFTVVFVAIFFLGRQKRIDRVQQIATDAKRANDLGMHMESDVQQIARFKTATNENYSGTTGAIVWTLQSREIYNRNSRHGSSWRYTTQWKSDSIKFPGKKFLMLMSTPGFDNTKHQAQRKGFLSSITNALAEGAIDMYVSGYFGNQYTAMINIDGSAKINLPELNDFFILTSDESLSHKFLSELTIKYITNWMATKPHFVRDSQVKHFGVLFAPDCTIVSCQTNMANAEEAKVFSDFGAALATLMSEAQGLPVN